MTRHERRAAESRRFHTPAQVAERWQCSTKSIYRMINRKALVAHRFGNLFRISDDDLLAAERLRREA